MAFYDKFPYTNFQELNLDKIIFALKTMQDEMKEFISNNVIKYADPIQWDITKQYEANTIVADQDGNAYISSKPVPIGVALSNTEYWSQIGNFDALFNVIKDAISPYNVPMLGSTATAAQPVNDFLWVGDDLYKTTAAINAGDTIASGTNVTESNINQRIREIMSSLTAGLTSVRTDFTAADDDIRLDFHAADSSIRNTINANQSANNARFQAIENQIASLEDKYYIFIGDSFAGGWTPDGQTVPFPILFKNDKNIQNDHFFNSAIGGAGWVRGTTYLTQLTNMYGQIPDHSKITDIYVTGGRNDFGAANAEIITAKRAFMSYVKANYPYATVHIGCLGRSFEYDNENCTMTQQFNCYYAYCAESESMGAQNMYNLVTCLDDSNLFASDMKHPNQDGQNAIYNAINAIEMGGIFQQSTTIYPQLQPSGISSETQSSGDISMTEINGIVSVVMFSRSISTTPTQVTLSEQRYEIGTFDRILVPGANYRTYFGYGVAVLNMSGTFFEVPVLVYIMKNKLWIQLSATNAAHNNYLSGELRQIQLKGVHMSYSAIRGS